MTRGRGNVRVPVRYAGLIDVVNTAAGAGVFGIFSGYVNMYAGYVVHAYSREDDGPWYEGGPFLTTDWGVKGESGASDDTKEFPLTHQQIGWYGHLNGQVYKYIRDHARTAGAPL